MVSKNVPRSMLKWFASCRNALAANPYFASSYQYPDVKG
jgi:hypothetical protein